MPGFVIHAFVPLLVMLAMRRYFDPAKVVWLWPLTLFPDLDYFFGIHRATTGSLFVTVFPAVFVLLWARWGPANAAWLDGWARVAVVYVGSHLLMDTFTGGIVPFYPLTTWTFCWDFAVFVTTATNTPDIIWGACSHDGAPVVSAVYPALDYDQGAMLAFLSFAWVAYAATRAWERWKPEKAPRGP